MKKKLSLMLIGVSSCHATFRLLEAAFLMAVLVAGMLAMPVSAAEIGMAHGPAKPPMYHIEKTELHSTNMTTTGELVEFKNLKDVRLENTLNVEIRNFYDQVFSDALENGIPYPSLDIKAVTEDYGGQFILIITATTAYPDNTKMKTLQIVLDNKENAVPHISEFASDVIKLSQTADGYYREDGVSMVPFRKVCEYFGFAVDWDGTSGHVDNGTDKFVVTPGVNDYDGRPLERAPVNRYGSIHVPASFFNDVLGIFCEEADDEMILAKALLDDNNMPGAIQAKPAELDESEAVHLIGGSVFDATMDGVTIKTDDGRQLSFLTEDVTNKQGITLDAYIVIGYTGEINGTDTKTATIKNINGYALKPDITTFVGTVEEASMNTVTIKTVSGRTLTFSTMDADKSNSGGLITGSTVAVEFKGDVVGDDAGAAVVLSVTKH